MPGKRSWLLVSSLILIFCSSLIQAETIKLKVKVTTANIRLKPDLGSQIVNTTNAGAILESDERLGDWFKVSLPSRKSGIPIIGYIHMSNVEIQADAPPIKKNVPVRDNSKEAARETERAVPAAEPASAQYSGVRWGIKLTGGMAYLSGGDANANRTSNDAYWRDRAQQPGSEITMEGGTKSINWGMNWEGDVVYDLNPRLGIGIGIGFIQVSKDKDQSRIISRWPGEIRTDDRGHKFRAVPIKLGVFYNLLQASKINLFLNAGVGYYLATWEESEDYSSQSEGTSWLGEYETTMHSGGFGFHGGLGLEYRLFRNVALVVEGFGRYARFSEFSGEYTEKKSNGVDVKDEGKLYYYEWSYNNKDYPWIELLDRDPSEINFSSPIKNARKAVIDFSGFSFRAGIHIFI